MRRIGRRTGLAIGGGVIVLATFAFLQARGGLSEALKVPAKLDSSTPAVQGGFEFLGAARVTEDERAPRLAYQDLLLGGGSGFIGSSRIWFRLPVSVAGKSPVPKDDSLKATVTFSDGASYPAQWEMADLSQRIATLLIPAGHPPSEWIDISIEEAQGKAKWRITGIPKTPRAIPTEAKATFEAEGLKLSASARHMPRKKLNLETNKAEAVTGLVEVKVEGPVPKDVLGIGTRVRFVRFVPEYRHPLDVRESEYELMLQPGVKEVGTVPVAFPYADRLRQFAVYGSIEVFETKRTPLEFREARWFWEGPKPGNSIRVQSEQMPLPSGFKAYVSGRITDGKPEVSVNMPKSLSNTPAANEAEEAIEELRVESPPKNWQREVMRLSKEATEAGTLPMGPVHASLMHRKVIRRVPFKMVVSVGPADPKDLALKFFVAPPSGLNSAGRPQIAVAGVGTR